MRLKPLKTKDLKGAQRKLADTIEGGIKDYLHNFKSHRQDGALIGPFNPMVHFPEFGTSAWGVFMALMENTTLPKPAHEVAILVTGAHFSSRYEIYAHEQVAKHAKLSPEKIATITAGQRPSDLSKEEIVAYNVAAVLVRGGQLPESTYQASLKTFGDKATAELIYLVGCYSMISILLNAYDISVPGKEEGLG